MNIENLTSIRYAEERMDVFRGRHRRPLNNYFLNPEELEWYIKECPVQIAETEAALFFLIEEQHFIRILYFLAGNSEMDFPKREKPYLCEVYKKKQETGEDEEALQNAGFLNCASYRRMLLKETESGVLRTGQPEERVGKETLVYIQNSFDILSDDIPDCEWRKKQFLEEHFVLGKPTEGAILIYSMEGRVSTLKYLFVAEEKRGKGTAHKLMQKYFSVTSEQAGRYVLWVREDNVPAKKLYQSTGYAEDAMQKAVYIKK